jgi:hypothetical protein
MSTQRNADTAELARFAELAPRWSSTPRLRDALKRIARGVRGSGRDAGRTSTPRLRDALKRIARGVRGSGRDAGRTTGQGWSAALEVA